MLWHSTLRILVTVGSALRMRPGFGWMLAFSAVFNLGANSLSSVLNQICKGKGREGRREETEAKRGKGDGGWDVLCKYGEQHFIHNNIQQQSLENGVEMGARTVLKWGRLYLNLTEGQAYYTPEGACRGNRNYVKGSTWKIRNIMVLAYQDFI